MARSLASSPGRLLSHSSFVDAWKSSFGPCGSYVGYCDSCTRTTILNALKVGADNERLTYPPSTVTGAACGALYMGVKAAAAAGSGGAELAARAAAVAVEAGAPEASAWAVAAAAAWERLLRAPIASSDDQSNTLGKLVPAAIAAAGAPDFSARVDAAVRLTQDSDEAVGYFVPLARAIEAAVLGTASTPRAAVEAALPHFDAARGARMREALAAADDAALSDWDAIAKFGASCAAASTAPVVAFVLARHGARGFEAAVRVNMVGESAARACVIGAVLAPLLGGAPAEWLARLDPALREEALALAPRIAGDVAV